MSANNIDEDMSDIEYFISHDTEKKNNVDLLINHLLSFDSNKHIIPHTQYVLNFYDKTINHISTINSQMERHRIMDAKIRHRYTTLRRKCDKLKNMEPITPRIQQQIDYLTVLIDKHETALSRLKILHEIQLELRNSLYSFNKFMNNFYLHNSRNSLQQLASTAIPEERIRKLSPKSRKILKTIKRNSMNVFVPNESLGSSPETSPETAAEYVKRTSYAITKRSARSRKQRYKK